MTQQSIFQYADQKFQELTSREMLNAIRYQAVKWFGQWWWIDDTFSINRWDGHNVVIDAKFVSKRDMVILHRLILTGETVEVDPLF